MTVYRRRLVCNNRFVKYELLGDSQCRERAANNFEMMKNICAKMLKFGTQIFFARELYNSPGTFVDLRNSFYEIWFIIFRHLVCIIFGIFRTKMIECCRKIFFTRVMNNCSGNHPGLSGTSRTVCKKEWYVYATFSTHDFRAENDKIMIEFCDR